MLILAFEVIVQTQLHISLHFFPFLAQSDFGKKNILIIHSIIVETGKMGTNSKAEKSTFLA